MLKNDICAKGAKNFFAEVKFRRNLTEAEQNDETKISKRNERNENFAEIWLKQNQNERLVASSPRKNWWGHFIDVYCPLSAVGMWPISATGGLQSVPTQSRDRVVKLEKYAPNDSANVNARWKETSQQL